ncbi:MAG: pirin family protein [Deltaproteobacteria bacterium]|nr:pirin family protein [Deltaproteobacteria bacterium]
MDPLILDVRPLGFPWETVDPFLFCVHHQDAYPAGTERLGPPPAALHGRDLGQDFQVRDGWRMYHGEVVPGFPQHPHRGFETVTIVRRGLVDHSDSLGAAARFGHGDVQWLTAGTGIVHSEMFPLLEQNQPNPLELFQIWLNLPAADKHAEPHFSMLWAPDIPVVESPGARVTVVAGTLAGQRAPPPPPRSWARRPDSDVAIWSVRLDAGATLHLPRAAGERTARTLYFFAGPSVAVGDHVQREPGALFIRADRDVTLTAGDGTAELLLLQGRPIGEPVVQYGPFVMNTPEEIQRAFQDYRRTQFGGWPWPENDPVHGRQAGRFARHADGRVERAAE